MQRYQEIILLYVQSITLTIRTPGQYPLATVTIYHPLFGCQCQSRGWLSSNGVRRALEDAAGNSRGVSDAFLSLEGPSVMTRIQRRLGQFHTIGGRMRLHFESPQVTPPHHLLTSIESISSIWVTLLRRDADGRFSQISSPSCHCSSG